MITARKISFLFFALALASCSAEDKKKPAMEVRTEVPAEPTGKVVKTDAEWKKQLTPAQYAILRQSDTERPNGEVYNEFKHQGKGSYHCAGCNALLFTSDQKFDSGCGWPSFYDPAKAENVILKKDVTLGMTRIEVTCAVCGGHLGHVFEGEGYKTPTDKRFCINGGGLVFVPAKEEAPAKPEAAKK
jgi:peptide-methionine (R)-S-oxide reductase